MSKSVNGIKIGITFGSFSNKKSFSGCNGIGQILGVT